MTSPVPGHDVPTGEQPGAGSTPADEGDGTVGLADRTDGGAPAANQTKVEPLPPSPGHTSPVDAPGPVSGLDPDEMRMRPSQIKRSTFEAIRLRLLASLVYDLLPFG